MFVYRMRDRLPSGGALKLFQHVVKTLGRSQRLEQNREISQPLDISQAGTPAGLGMGSPRLRKVTRINTEDKGRLGVHPDGPSLSWEVATDSSLDATRNGERTPCLGFGDLYGPSNPFEFRNRPALLLLGIPHVDREG